MSDRQKGGEMPVGYEPAEPATPESTPSKEVASLREHREAKQRFLKSKFKLLEALDQQLEQLGSGRLYSLHYSSLVKYLSEFKKSGPIFSRIGPHLELDCLPKGHYSPRLNLQINGYGMEFIHSELAPAVLESRQKLVETFQRLAKEDQRDSATLPQFED